MVMKAKNGGDKLGLWDGYVHTAVFTKPTRIYRTTQGTLLNTL